MDKYYVNNNAQSNGDHEVHVITCSFFPLDSTDLGEHRNCAEAIKTARNTYTQSNGCFYCCNECHSR